jgi:hypothetical protein
MGSIGAWMGSRMKAGESVRTREPFPVASPESPGRSLHVHTHPSGAELWRHIIEIAAFIVAAGWAFYVFVYQERIKPAQTLPQAQITAGLLHQPVQSGAESVTVTFEIHNVGSTPFKMAGFVINAYGFHYIPRIALTMTTSMNRNVTTVRNSLAESKPVLLQSVYARFATFGSARTPFLAAPGADSKRRYTFGIARGTYDVIFLRYKYCFTFYDNAQVYDPGAFRQPDGAYWFRYFDPSPDARVRCGQESRDQFPL